MINCKRFETRIDGLYEVVRRQDKTIIQTNTFYDIPWATCFCFSLPANSTVDYTSHSSQVDS